VATLDQVLASPGALKREQIELATHTRDEQKRRVARLAVTTNVPATVEVDGLAAGQTPLAQPLAVASGAHIVTAVAPGYLPARKEVAVAGEASADVSFELLPTDAKAGHLIVKTALPDAEVLVDGQVVGRTPLPSSLTLVPGRRSVELRRAGYVPSQKQIELGDGASGTLAFDLEEDPATATEGWGYLVLSVSEDQAEVTIDGRSRGVYRQSLRVLPGAHLLRVERGGFEPIERITDIRPRAETLVRVTMQPTPDTRVAYVERTHRQCFWGRLSAGVGAAVAGTATVFVLVNGKSLGNAKKERDAVDALFVRDSGRDCDPSLQQKDFCLQRQADAYDKTNKLQLQQNIGYVALGIGAAALVTGAVLLLSNDDPHKYDQRESELGLVPFGWAAAGGGGLGLSGRF
jgi:hypothetical protein